MYISKIIFDVSKPAVRRHLISLDLLRKTLKSLTAGKGFIYRIEDVPLKENNFLQPLVMVSKEKPDPGASGMPDGFIASIESLNYNIPIRPGMNYSFYLKANPSTRIFFKRVEIDGAESQKTWLQSESHKNGFELIQCEVMHYGYITCEAEKKKFLSSVFKGALKITDQEKFSRALFEGIGPGREYGLGLLSIESFGCRNRNIAEEMKHSVKN